MCTQLQLALGESNCNIVDSDLVYPEEPLTRERGEGRRPFARGGGRLASFLWITLEGRLRVPERSTLISKEELRISKTADPRRRGHPV